MTVLGTTSRRVFNCNGATVFSLGSDFLFLSEDDLVVIRIDAEGTETALEITTDYTVTQEADKTGSVTSIATYDDGQLVVYRDIEAIQQYDAETGDGFNTDTFEEQLDRMIMVVQQCQRDVGRAIRLADADTVATSTQLPVPKAGEIIRWNDDGSGLTSSLPPFGTMIQYRQQIIATEGQTVFTLTGGLEYSPNANNISVDVDGRRQVSRVTDPSDGSYYETNSTTITFDEGLSAGQKVVLTVNTMDSSTGLVGSATKSAGKAVLWDAFALLDDYADDAAAAAGGVAVGELYRNGSVIQVRVA